MKWPVLCCTELQKSLYRDSKSRLFHCTSDTQFHIQHHTVSISTMFHLWTSVPVDLSGVVPVHFQQNAAGRLGTFWRPYWEEVKGHPGRSGKAAQIFEKAALVHPSLELSFSIVLKMSWLRALGGGYLCQCCALHSYPWYHSSWVTYHHQVSDVVVQIEISL